MRMLFCLLGWVCWGQTGSFAQSAHQSLRAGDREYGRENYTAAQRHYQDAVRQNPGSLNATYNLGCAEYRQGRYPEAEKAFQEAVAGSQLSASKADALYNLGNAQLKQHKWREAIETYENSLRLRPGDAAAKQNLQMAKQKLKDEQQKPPQQGDQPPPSEQKPPQQEPSNQPPEQPAPGEAPPQNSDQQPGDDQQPSPSSPEPGKMTRQEAQRMLETTIGPEDRKNARKYRAAVQPKKVPKTRKKDW